MANLDGHWSAMKTPLAIRVVLFCMMIAGVCGVPGMAFADTATTSESTLSETAIAERHAALRERAISSGPIPVIVKLRIDQELETRLDTPGIAAQRQRLADSQVAVLDRLGLRTPLQQSTRAVKRFAITPALAMHVDVADLDALLDDPLVSEVVEDGLEFPALSESVPLIGASSNGDFAGRTGLGQVVAILDSGVTKSHSFLTGKVVSEACYSSTVASSNTTSLCPGGASQSTATDSALDCDLAIASCGHGTHIAGIAAGSGSSFSGVAKDAKIIAMQVYSQANSLVDCYPRSTPCLVTFVSDQIKALERVYALRSSFNIAAANLSLGTGSYSGYCDTDARKPIIDQLRGAGIATVVASGNSGATTATSAPACISSAVSVGSTTKLDAMAASSNSAWFLNLLAPGENIGSSSPPNTYAFRSGTSYSAPHVVGAWAVLKQAKPTGSVDELLNALVSTGKPITDNRSGAGGRVKPRIQLAQAVGQFVTFTLNVSSSGASAVSISADQAIYAGVTNYSKSGIPAGTTITLTAPAAVGYANFTAWSGCDSTSGTSCTLTMNSDRSPTVSYTTPTYSLSVDSSGASTVAITANPSTYAGTTNYSKTGIPAGTTFTLTAPAAVGYTSFSAWSGCDSTSGTSCTLTMTANRTVAVSYVTPSYSLSVDSSGASAVAITAEPSAYAGTTNYSKTGILAGTTVILTAPAMVDSIGFGAWSGCDSTSGTSCTLTMTANRTVTVSYAVASHTLTVSSTGVSGVAISAEPPSYAGITDYSLSDIATGTMITLTAPGTLDSANFSAWSGCDSTSGTSCTLTMTANRTVAVS
ncbi:MAG: hypothetical protein EOM91_07155, partial [Sphingobacteriia bacterium]|nr:hypothetical protein [Sphingobacteriia bacterium]